MGGKEHDSPEFRLVKKATGRHRPSAITQRDAIFLFSKVNKTAYGKKFCKICIPNGLIF